MLRMKKIDLEYMRDSQIREGREIQISLDFRVKRFLLIVVKGGISNANHDWIFRIGFVIV